MLRGWDAVRPKVELLLSRNFGFLPVGFRQVGFPELPQVLVDLFEVVLLQPIEGAEGQQGIVEPLVILEIAPTEVGEMVLLHESIEDLVHVAVIDGERQGVMVATVFCGEGIEVLFGIFDRHFLDGPDQGEVPGLEPLIDVQRKDVLRHREGGVDVGGVKVVQGGDFEEDVLDVGVLRAELEEELIQSFLLQAVVLKPIPCREVKLDLTD